MTVSSTVSMTGFAARRGAALGFAWAWDIRSVNGKGLELRLRVPDWVDGLEASLRGELQKAIARGNVSLSLRLSREVGEAPGLRVNEEVLSSTLAALARVEEVAMAAGLTLAQPTSADVLGMRGVLDHAAAEEDTGPLRAAILADLPALLADFNAMRAGEGAALAGVITGQLDQIEALLRDAKAQSLARRDKAGDALRQSLARLLENAEGLDETRIAQELAILAVKQDVTEETDRLGAHIAAARALLTEKGPVGRKFDFMMQEFLREANTLLSKSQDLALTRTGLDLKTVIDQMREQVQNVE
ncbi:YicC/YloC family endoribonuclease [Xinfangfangia sp. CPCC 101601]|uniref:YicC/YloC family endoribonuclease n=1 Tax=Pseudogemmobacter lacusdianii TaxID=3069608 RepID=A0ABU0VV85_9RHOB|nr:YicC/YloC family endoribonuclease [Xinfangfangia sp. CPCC 101601]MDQ2065624.1 YicC/YloC family endoribonuclease [Xinfangfangia sp. CPCC 101601]